MSWSVHAALIAVQVLFASLAIVGRFVLPEFPAGALVMIRVLGAGLILLTVNLLRGGERVRDRRDLLELAGLGLLGITLNQSLFVFGLKHTTAINATILVTMVPVFTLVGAVLLGRERASKRKLGGVALAGTGAVWLIGPDRITLAPDVAFGNLLILIGMVCYAAYFLLAQRQLRKHDALTVTTYVMLTSIVTVAPVGLPALLRLDPSGIRPAIWLGVAWIVVGPTVFTYLLNIWALRRVSSSVVAVYIYLQPLLTAAVAPMLLTGESLTARTTAAGLLIFSGVSFVLAAERRPGPVGSPVRTG
jgi:drug/metabolite transporter (DMT)-like permease